MEKVGVIGLGYVGLPLSIAAANSGFKVIGVDSNVSIVSDINNGISSVEDISNNEITNIIASDRFRATSNYKELHQVDIILVCVPTPLYDDHTPDLSYVKSATKSISKVIKKNNMIIFESTVGPGTTRDYLIPILEHGSGLTLEDFEVAFSPERVDPVNNKWNLKNTPKIVSGLTPKSQSRAINFYSKFIDSVVAVESIEVAEIAKLLENSYRFVNISFINEMAVFCQILGVDINHVIEAAATKPYGFMSFYPSIGIGGHCIPVDPLYLASKAREIGAPSRFIDLAHKVNQEMPGYFVGRAEEKIGGLKDKRILVVGVSYKANVADIRETPVEALINGLKQKGAMVFWHDDLVKEWNGEKSVVLSNNYDLAILATPHDYLDLTKLGNVPILNTRGSI